MTGMERLWLSAERRAPPFIFNQIIEGEGTFSESALREGLGALVEAWPILRGRVRGGLWWSRWEEGPASPTVRSAPGGQWPTDGLLHAPALSGPLNVYGGPPVELVIASDQQGARLVIRTHHALLDGRGALTLSLDLFRALRGEAPLGQQPWVSDVALLEAAGPAPLPAPTAPPLGRGAFPPTGQPLREDVVYARVRFRAPTSGITARGILATRDACRARWAHHPEHTAPDAWIASVPVDLRRGHPEAERAPGTLTALARVPLDAATPEQLDPVLRAAVLPANAGASVRAAHGLRALPLALLGALGRAGARRLHERGLTDLCFTFSNMGVLRLAEFAAPGFTARHVGFTPPGAAGIPLLAVLTGHDGGLELHASAPAALAPDHALPELLRDIVGRLGGSII